jgi:hypothetical protein
LLGSPGGGDRSGGLLSNAGRVTVDLAGGKPGEQVRPRRGTSQVGPPAGTQRAEPELWVERATTEPDRLPRSIHQAGQRD